MQVAVIADAYPPMRTSGAIQLRDLVAEFSAQGHEMAVILPDPDLDKPWDLQKMGSITELRLRAPRTKDVSYIRRAVAEYRLSGAMYSNYLKSPLHNKVFDGIVWYSPTIFLGALVAKLRAISHCPSYLILRDIFPEWAVDMGLLGKGFIYRYFKAIEKFQYLQADTIGVQTLSNTHYFNNEHPDLSARIEVLNNWLSSPVSKPSSIQISDTSLAGRRIFAYTGNIGIAQGIEIVVELAEKLKDNHDVGFVFVGRGTAVNKVRKLIAAKQLENVLMYDEIDPDEISDFLDQCHVGLIALDPRHRNDNIPGKFLAYMQTGLPVLATINEGNDLEKMINDHQVGRVITSNNLDDLIEQADNLLKQSAHDDGLKARCEALAKDQFSSTAAVSQIVAAFSG